ncbi:VWFA and cache domain-containing protein 1-like [Anneissia japonica]|uniref:VWFA and cache domain-containing protein 1-like n=1 Tax=Anneissia japonica TaxID=1529436 RepID=UPI001425A55E|nr:VWFA and cache domain-containing protein 1-like [Anneissia japonica]
MAAMRLNILTNMLLTSFMILIFIEAGETKKSIQLYNTSVNTYSIPLGHDIYQNLGGGSNSKSKKPNESKEKVDSSSDAEISSKLLREAGVLANKFKDIVDTELAYKSMQRVYDSVEYVDGALTESEQLQELTFSVGTKLAKYLKQLDYNKNNVEKLYQAHRSQPILAGRSCCKLQSQTLHYSSVFKCNISQENACDLSSPVVPSGAFNPVKNLTQIFKNTMKKCHLAMWQYWSSEEGVHVVYPSTGFSNINSVGMSCDESWDARSRPVYSSTVRPQQKKVVILIERGSWVSNEQLKLAQEAAVVALGVLCEHDLVGVVAVGSTIETCQSDSCYGKSLAPASIDTKQQLITFIKSISKDSDSSLGSTNHTLGLKKAFSMIKQVIEPEYNNVSLADCIIVYISSGNTSGKDEAKKVVKTVVDENQQINNRVIIMTYALIDDGRTGLEELAFLRDLAEQNTKEESGKTTSGKQAATDPMRSSKVKQESGLPLPQKGAMTVLNQMSNLPSTIGRFYINLPVYVLSNPTFSLPYIDPIGEAYIISLTKPCFYNQELIGIVGIDVSVGDLLEDITYYHEGEVSYAFIADKNGNALSHPSLPRPLFVKTQPSFVDIALLEQAPGFDAVKKSMMSGDRGQLILRQSINSTADVKFIWMPVPGSPYSICIVRLEANQKMRHLQQMKMASSDGSILYHRLDLIPTNAMCMHLKQLGTKTSGTLMLAASSFNSPYQHISQEETKHVVQGYLAYLNDNTMLISNPGFKPTIKNDVRVTKGIEKFWMSQIRKSELNDYIVRRYLVTITGVLRMYPGTLMDKNYEPSLRSWYVRALDNPGLVTVSSPYLDVGGGGYVVTISHVLYEGSSTGKHDPSDRVVAVVGIDFTIRYFYKLLLDTLPMCRHSTVRCFMIDDAGYLIAHPSLVEPAGKGPIEKQHVTHKEPLVANDILNHQGFVKKKSCNSYPDDTIQRLYQFNTSWTGLLFNLLHKDHCQKYKIVPIPGTNAFMGIVNETCDMITTFCPCSTVDRVCLNCHRMEQTECECPCECTLKIDQCGGTITLNDKKPSCPCPEEPVILPKVDASLTQDLPQCYESNCKARTTYDSCFGVLDCEWCEIDQDGSTLLSSPYCATQRECFGGVLGAKSPYGDEEYSTFNEKYYNDGTGAQVGPMAGGLMGFIVVLALSFFIYRHNVHRLQRLEMANYQDASVRMSQENEADIEDDSPMDPTRGGGAIGGHIHANIVLAALDRPSPYHQRMRHHVWRHHHGGTPSESDHGYSTMTPHEDSEYHYVEPEPLHHERGYHGRAEFSDDASSVSTSLIDPPLLNPPPRVSSERQSRRNKARSYHIVPSQDILEGQEKLIEPLPGQTVLPSSSSSMFQVPVQVHHVDTAF